jgi:hypothetical protein
LGIVIEAPLFPADRIVAQPAICAQATFVMLVAVTPGAIERRVLEIGRSMTPFAGHGGVLADQRESGEVVIERRRSAPGDLGMTLLALGAKLSLVPVVFAVTRDACCRQLVAIEIAGMAGVALNRRVGAPQRIFCFLVVIKMNRGPLAFAVTALAFGSVTPGVNVLYLVTAHARRSDPAITLTAVAGETGNGTVRLMEREFGRSVVEGLGMAPFGFAVTLVAAFPQSPLMRINGLVTVKAASRRTPELGGRSVTAAARHRHMRIPQREICRCVIEGFPVELNDIAIAADVVAMAMATVLFRSIRPAPMHSLASRTICGNLLVAGKTEVRLRLAGERLMTFAALLLELGVSFHDRSRQDKLLEQVLRARARRQYTYENAYNRHHAYKSSGHRRPSRTQKKCAAKTWMLAAITRRTKSGK